MEQNILMSGNEAIARGAYEAGVRFSSAYPGTPSTEINENMVKYKDAVYCEWSVNEKTALEAAIGASIRGVRAMASMKHVGLNVASDPLFSSSYIGALGGLVIVVADDPGIHSSQNEQDTRCVAKSALIPVIEPSDSQEAKDFLIEAFNISEKYDTPVIFRTATKLSHSISSVKLNEPQTIKIKDYKRNSKKNILMPAFSRKRHEDVQERMEKLSRDSCYFNINSVEYNDKKRGFITSGVLYQYVKEVFSDASVLKLGMINPLPYELIKEFSEYVDELYIFEELEPLIECQVKAMGIKCYGKDIFTTCGEYSASMLKEKILGKEPISQKYTDIPKRTPVMCAGCPHRSIFQALKELHMHAAGDIGCYTLGAVKPFEVLDSVICMGASISSYHGMCKSLGKEAMRDWVAVIGDSTFLHTGMNSLLNMSYNNGTGIIIICDNNTTAMTGHQSHAATGITLQKEIHKKADLKAICMALGADKVYEINAYDIDGIKQIILKVKEEDKISVIIAKAPCVLLKENVYYEKCAVNTSKCVKCESCLNLGCPAIRKNKNGLIQIDKEMCNGCSLCEKRCPANAINIIKEC